MLAIPSCVIFLLLAVTNGQAVKCPNPGKTGQIPPDIMSLVPNQAGFHAHVEIIGGFHYFTELEESFNDASQVGSIRFNDISGKERIGIEYYFLTNEVFNLNRNSGCLTQELNETSQMNVFAEWLNSETLENDIKSIGPFKSLGPVALIDAAAKVDPTRVQYVGRETLDGVSTVHYFYCLETNGLQFDLYYDESKKTPFRLEISHSGDHDKHTINYVYFKPVIPKKDEPISYPWGRGCVRLKNPTVSIPRFFDGIDPLFLSMEAAVFDFDSSRTSLSMAEVARLQGVLSYVLSEGNTSTRIVHDPNLLMDWIIDSYTGSCLEKTAEAYTTTVYEESPTYLRWPYSDQEKYNLLDKKILELGQDIQYLGQIDTESGRMDIFEKNVPKFLQVQNNGYFHDALITYFFPVTEQSKGTRYQAPYKIIMEPQTFGPEPFGDYSRIELTVIDWRKSQFDYEYRFDISNCYDKPGQYTWFQIVFSDTVQHMEELETQETRVRDVFEQAISNIIPKLRFPEVRVAFIGSNLYLTGKLLQRPSFKFSYIEYPDTSGINPIKIVIREHEEDCSEYCSEEEKCNAFAYCDNLNCLLFDTEQGNFQLSSQTGCTYNEGPHGEEKKGPLMASSKALLHRLKHDIDQGLFELESLGISAEDLFIVNGPGEIGGVDSEFGDDTPVLPSGEDYVIMSPGERLVEGIKTLGSTYQQCLAQCAADDDCQLLSYCFSSRNQECTIYSPEESEKSSSSQDLATLSEGCDIFIRKSTNFFTKFAGKSLVTSAASFVPNIGVEQCATACMEEKKFNCESFDFCLEPFNKMDQRVEPGCFLHTFHLARDASQLDGKIWNFNGTGCDHYAKKYSKDYQHYLGRRLEVTSSDIIGQLDGVPLENCALSCNTAQQPCNSFEFCEEPHKSSSNAPLTSCRISKFRPGGGAQGLQSTNNYCSVYVPRNPRSPKKSQSNRGLGLAMGLGSFMFIIALAGGVFGTQYYLKRRP